MTQIPTLDPAQEIRIEAVHRSFLYQHLYAAACLLASGQTGATSVVVERDEDIEYEAREVSDEEFTSLRIQHQNAPSV